MWRKQREQELMRLRRQVTPLQATPTTKRGSGITGGFPLSTTVKVPMCHHAWLKMEKGSASGEAASLKCPYLGYS